MEIAVAVEIALIAGREAIGLEDLPRRRPWRQVGVEEARPPEADLASVVGTGRDDGLAVLAAQPDFVARQRATERFGLRGGAREVHHGQPHLDDAERLDERPSEACAERVGHSRA